MYQNESNKEVITWEIAIYIIKYYRIKYIQNLLYIIFTTKIIFKVKKSIKLTMNSKFIKSFLYRSHYSEHTIIFSFMGVTIFKSATC